jgi:predicted alpha/beta hydrolase family esterase
MGKKGTILIVPGYADSSPKHWQGIWLEHFPNAVKVIQKDWIHVDQSQWVETLDAAIRLAKQPILLVGHSLGCLTILYWVISKEGQQSIHKIRGAFLVAPPDPNSEAYRALSLRGFDSFPLKKLPFSSILVASENDPFLTLKQGRYYADCLGSQFVNIGKKGHIGEDSGLGEWNEGKALLDQLLVEGDS